MMVFGFLGRGGFGFAGNEPVMSIPSGSDKIFHITPRTTWEESQANGEYRGDTLAGEGFIHCCTPEQVAGVYGRYFRGQSDLLVLRIDSGRLTSPLRWENPPGSDEMFPHLYGPLNLDAVIEVVPLETALRG
jgi:uncharacterized protein (DUF952 family)